MTTTKYMERTFIVNKIIYGTSRVYGIVYRNFVPNMQW